MVPPAPPKPITALEPDVQVALLDPFHHWLAVSQVPVPSVWPVVAPLASQVRVSTGLIENTMGVLVAAARLIPEDAVAVNVIVSAAE